MKLNSTIGISILSLAVAVSSVACTQQSFSNTQDKSNSLSSKGNGDSYTGKTYKYRVSTLCSDGTDVASAIAVDAIGNLALIKDNCENLTPPVALNPNQVDQPDNGQTIIYQDRVYTVDPALGGFVKCSGESLLNSGSVRASYSITIDLVSHITSGHLSYSSSVDGGSLWSMDFNNKPLNLLAGSQQGSFQEYFTDDGSANQQGYKAILDLNSATSTSPAIMFWPLVANLPYQAEFDNVPCVRYQ